LFPCGAVFTLFIYLFIYKHTGVVFYLDFGPFHFLLLLFPCGAVFPSL
jgi:hypothetical protein